MAESPRMMPSLVNYCDKEVLKSLMALYRDQLQEDITRITDAATRQDEHTIQVAAHRIVSASRALGLAENAQAASQIERYPESQPELDWGDFGQVIDQNILLLAG